ncbi:myosin-9 isoform X1 [Pygocentrus nattereri]|uniref:myosin-9 isoform X1 n=1 Tax=Pygocentrus nattereri TaxID=42514 RepID=UPI0008144D2A|nr:myosin-9 isoform X1 [Pygocentrus nattereri]
MAARDNWEWDYSLNPHSLQNAFRSLSPEFDLWGNALFKSRSSAWSCMGLSGSGHRSKISTSSVGSQLGMKQNESAGMRRWQSTSRLAPEGAPRAFSTQGVELRAALEESSMKRAELVQKLREAHEHLDTQTDLLKAKETQLLHSQSTTHLLELKHKQLTKALSALEEEKEAAKLSRFEESRRRSELQEKVVQLEMDLLKIKSSMGRRNSDQSSTSQTNPHLNKTMPVTKDDFLREGQKHTGREMKKLKEALREAEERAETLEAEKDHALKQLYSSKEGHRKTLNQAEQLKQKLSTSMQAQSELQEQLSESQSRLGQLELEKALLSTKSLQLEDNLEDLKVKLSAALADKDRLVQEKADLHQRTQSLKLQLQRAQLGREGFTEQVCELHAELSQAKSKTSRQQQSTLLMKEELHSAKEVSKKLSADLTAATERLQVTLKQLHELEAEKLIHTNQIAALETERLQLIGEKEELIDVFDQGNQEELRELRERCYQLRELKETLEHEKQDLQTHCQGLEKKVQNMEAELGCKEDELQRMEVELEKEKEELKNVATHWNERWLDVAMTLQSTQVQLEETKKQQQHTEALKEEASGMASMVEILETQLKDSQDEIQSLLEQKTHLETELCRVKKEAGALERVELDACRQQLDLERSRSQCLQQRLMGNPVSLEEMDGELVQVKAELQKVWDMLKSRDTKLEEQQQELQSARGQVTQQSTEVQRLEQQLAEREHKLKERDLTLKNLMSQKDVEKTEAQNKITALEKELTGLKALKIEQALCTDQPDTQGINSQLEASRKTSEQQKQERVSAPQRQHSPEHPQQGEDRQGTPLVTRKAKSVNFDLIDPNHQRRLITEQLKSLFKEREQLGDKASPVLQRRPASVVDCGPKSKTIKNSTDLLSSDMQLQHGQGLGVQQGAGKCTTANAVGAQSEPPASEKGLQGQLRQEQVSALSVEMEELKDRNENLLQDKLKVQQQIQDVRVTERCSEDTGFIDKEEEALMTIPPTLCVDGTFLARQVEVCDSEMEDEEVVLD